MCKLLGISFNKEVERNSMKYYLKEFFDKYGEVQPHGWGFTLYNSPNDAHTPVLFKEPEKASRSMMLRYILSLKHKSSKYVVAHVRYRSMGPINYELTQPFVDGSFTFIHNGTLFGLSNKIDRDISDSLHMFQDVKKFASNPAKLVDSLRSLNVYGSMSIIASNGSYLLAYRDRQGHTPLCYREFDGGYIICSEPIFGHRDNWIDIKYGEAVLFKNGKLVHEFIYQDVIPRRMRA